MSTEPLNPKTSQATQDYLSNPGQSVGLIGQKWLNQDLLARGLAERLLKIKDGALEGYPYFLYITGESAAISIDEIRAINDFISLKVPGNKDIDRIIVIHQADKMTPEAQNALLKNLEEPPRGTIFILTAESANSLLPTIVSRLHIINIYKPAKEALLSYYEASSDEAAINQAYLISDGLPELMDLLLTSGDNPYNEAVASAKEILSGTTLERLSLINDLAKKKPELGSLFFVLKQMAKIGISSSDSRNAKRWQRILSATIKGERRLKANVQVKLLLTDFVLDIS